MKKNFNLLIFSTVCLFAASVSASVQTVESQVEDHYVDRVRQVPREEHVCRDIVVEERSGGVNGNSGAIVLGAIVGNALGAASGVEHGRTLGTVIGGIAGNQIGSSSQHPMPPHQRIEQRCYTQVRYHTYTERVYSHSTVKFYLNGRWHQVQFKK